MSLQIRDGISPELARMARAVKDRSPILEAMGEQLVTIAQRSFSDATLRAAAWAPLKAKTIADKKRRGVSDAILKASTAMMKSIHITGLTNDHVTVGSDRPYAAIQQLGSAKASGRGSGIPPRPFFPFTGKNAMTAIAQEKIRKIALRKLTALLKV